jgi:hypothetical protein
MQVYFLAKIAAMYALLTLLLALSLQTASPAAKPKNPVVKNREATNKAGNSKQASPPVTPNTPVSTPVSKPTADDKKDDHHAESDKRVYRVKIISKPFDWLYVIYIIVTAIAAYVAWRALLAIREQGVKMGEQITEMKAAGIQTEKLIAAATKSADAVKISADALVASERAWIFVELTWGDERNFTEEETRYGIETTAHCYLSCENQGKTPGRIIEVCMRLVITDDVIPKEPAFWDARFDTYEEEFARVSEHAPIYPKDTPFKYRFKPRFIGQRGNKKKAFIYGAVKYRDVFMVGDGYRETLFGYRAGNDTLERIPGYEYNKNT